MRISVRVPVRVRIVGTPDEAQLEELARRVRHCVAARLAEADRILQQRHGVPSSGQREAREPYDDRRSGPRGYAVPSYDGPGLQVRVPVRRPGRPWVVLRSVQFRTLVGRYLVFVASVDKRQEVVDRPLYADLELDTRWVGVWWVQVNRPYQLDRLGEELTVRAGELARVGPHGILAWALTPFDAHRAYLAQLDDQGNVRSGIPSIHAHNLRRLAVDDGTLSVAHGGWLLYTFMVLPKVELTDVLRLGPTLRTDLPLADAGFLVDAELFDRKTGVDWARFAEEFAAERVPVWLQAATVRRRVHRDAASLLLSRFAGERTDTGGRPGDGRAPAESLFLLTAAQLAAFPAALRQYAESWTDDATRRIDAAADPHLQPAQRIAYALAWVDISADRLGQAQYGPLARDVAAQIVELLPGDPREMSWRIAIGNLLWRVSSPFTTRPPGGTPFEYVLVQLEAEGRLQAFFDAVDASDWFHLRHQLLLFSLATRYAEHPLVRRLLADLSARELAAGPHTMVPGGTGVGSVWLQHNPRWRLDVGDVFGEVDSVYITTKDTKRLKPAKADALRAALVHEHKAMAGELFKGVASGDYDGERFAREALGRALPKEGLTDEDFEKITIERSMRLLEVLLVQHDALPQYNVRFEFVERIKGSGDKWVKVGTEVLESADDFSARLIAWALGRVGELYETAGMAITLVGLAVVAWEAGLVAILVDAAGGTAAVLISIGISELLYAYQIIFHDAELTLRGVLEAALDGYLMALGFKWGAGLGRWGAKAIGATTTRRVVLGWFTERLIAGTVGGGTSAVMEKFAHESIGLIAGESSLSGITEYLKTLGIGAATGIVMEFTVQPVMHAALTEAGSAISSAAELAKLVRSKGWGAIEWSAAVTEALSNLRAALASAVEDAMAEGWARTLGNRLAEVSEQLGASTLARRVLELSGARFSRQATEGLERFLVATGSATPGRAVAIANAFARNPAETVTFFEVLATLDTAAARHLAAGTFAGETELAAFLGRLARYTPQEQRAVLGLLGELGIEARPPVPTSTAAQVLDLQFLTGLRLQAGGLELEAQQMQRRAAALLQRAEHAADNPRRAAALRAEGDRLAADAAALRERARALREEAAGPQQPTHMPPLAGLPRRVVYLDHSVIDQIIRGNAGAARALLALRAVADVRISHWTWRELVLHPAQAETSTAQRLIIEDLGIAVDDALPLAQRVDAVLAATPRSGRTGFSVEDTQVAIGARAGRGELWSFDQGFLSNPNNARVRFGLELAPEGNLPFHQAPQDYARARELLGLEPIEIQPDGSVVRGRARVALPSPAEVDAALGGIEAAGANPAAGSGATLIRLSQRAVRQDAAVLERVVRPVFRSRTGNRVVFRVQGGEDLAARSRELVLVDAHGNVSLATGGNALNLNFGVFERAVEFLLASRRGARLVVFEVEEGWFEALRSAATPEQGRAAVAGAPGIRDVQGLPRTVDTRYGENQLQIPGSLQPELQEFIVPGSGRVLEFGP